MIFVALGANLSGPWGGPEAGVKEALQRFASYGIKVVAVSALYRTPAITPYAQPDFVNAVAKVESALSPKALLAQLHRIEEAFGRVRTQRWQERTLDLDLLDYDGLSWPEAAANQLVLPHPRLSMRGFVLVPLAEIAPDWRHPVTGKSALDLLESLPESEKRGITAIP